MMCLELRDSSGVMNWTPPHRHPLDMNDCAVMGWWVSMPWGGFTLPAKYVEINWKSGEISAFNHKKIETRIYFKYTLRLCVTRKWDEFYIFPSSYPIHIVILEAPSQAIDKLYALSIPDSSAFSKRSLPGPLDLWDVNENACKSVAISFPFTLVPPSGALFHLHLYSFNLISVICIWNNIIKYFP